MTEEVAVKEDARRVDVVQRDPEVVAGGVGGRWLDLALLTLRGGCSRHDSDPAPDPDPDPAPDLVPNPNPNPDLEPDLEPDPAGLG